ncbi:MAG: T9SS type A sorting domain-containing protein [Flavipsychrobacter sp.]
MLASLDWDALWTGTVTTCQFSSTVSEDPGTGYEVEFSSHDDNGYYSGTQSGDKATLQAAILNSSNWTKNSLTGYTFPIAGSFSVGSSTTWNGSTWSAGAPSSTVDAVIASSTTPGAFTCKDLTINSSFSLTLGTGVTATIHGDMTNSGNGISGTGNLTFSKSGTSTLSGNAFSVLGVVTVSSGCTLATASKLTLASNASNTGSIGNSAGSISGSVTVQRYIPGKRCYRFLAHPFTSTQQVSLLTDDIDITGSGGAANGFTTTTTNNPSSHIWDVTTADNTTAGNNPGWSAITSATSSSWTKAGLLRVLVRGAKGEGLTGGAYTPSASTLDMTGTVNTGTQTITLTKGSGSTFVACGNPFPSPVQMNTVAKGSNVGANYYVWDATSGAKGAYVTNAFTTSYILPSGGALFTTVSANSNNTLEFQEADKSTSSPASIFKTTGANDWVELLISDSTLKWDRLLINFNDNSMDVQDKLDAVKLYNPGLDFFTMSKDGERLAIDVRPYTDKSSIPLGLTAYTNYNKYVIRTGDYSVPAGTKLILHDKYLNTQQELKAGFEYWFDVTSDTLSQGNNRFEINMVGKPTNIITTSATTPKIQLIPNPAHNEVKVSFDNVEGTALVKLTNITGQVVYLQEVNAASGSLTIPLTNMPSGMYIVELQSQNARFTEKLIKE